MVVIAWMCMIFMFSAMPADDSTQTSLWVGEKICSVTVPGYQKLNEETKLLYAENIDHGVRKTAHATEYAMLAVLMCWAIAAEIQLPEDTWRRRNFLAWFFTTGYAATDEFHQLFVTGRSGQVTDVMIDSAGALAGILLMTCMTGIVRKYKNRHMKEGEVYTCQKPDKS